MVGRERYDSITVCLLYTSSYTYTFFFFLFFSFFLFFRPNNGHTYILYLHIEDFI